MATASMDLKGKGHQADRGFRWLALRGRRLGAGDPRLHRRHHDEGGAARLPADGVRLPAHEQLESRRSDVFGAAAFIYGTLLTSFIALLLAVPVSLGIALFITQVAPPWLRKPMVYVLDLLAVVPSVVFGLWGVLVLAPGVQGFYQNLANWCAPIPVLGKIFSQDQVSGRSFLTAGMILAIMIVPIVTSLSREVIETTPEGEREAASGARRHALGDDPRRRDPPQQGRLRGCRHARAGTSHG